MKEAIDESLESGDVEILDQILDAQQVYEEGQEDYLPSSPDESPTFESSTGETYTCICPPSGGWCTLCTCRHLNDEDKMEQAKHLLREGMD